MSCEFMGDVEKYLIRLKRILCSRCAWLKKIAGDKAIQEQISSPKFLEISNEGVFVNLELIEEAGLFLTFVSEIFAKGYYLHGINYQNFHKILYDFDKFKSRNTKVFLAGVIAALPPEKAPLYVRFKIRESTAYYDFGSVTVKAADGREIEARITFDELAAAAWNSQIRFGLNEQNIRQRINEKSKGMAEIAKSTLPVKGEDARLDYLTKMEKDLAPVEDPKTGRLDLKRNKCTFPQVLDIRKNKIIRKVNATEGTPGHYLNGKPIPPKPGHDLNLDFFVGDGTEVITEEGTDYLVANRVGYLVVKPRSNRISVTAEAQNHSPIGPETGNLEIKAGQFIQYGDILSGYSVRCNNISVEDGNVNGEITTKRGRIDVKNNVNSGRLVAQDGIIRVNGIVTMNSYVESIGGDIIVETVENSTLIGCNVSVKSCVNSIIVGETIKIEKVQSSKILGMSIVIEDSEESTKTGERTDIIIPVLELTDKRIRAISHVLDEKKKTHAQSEEKLRKMKENKILQAYLTAVKADDKSAINALRWHATPIMNEINRISKDTAALQDELSVMENNLSGLRSEHENKVAKMQSIQQCTIEKSLHDSVMLKLYGGLDWPAEFSQIEADEVSYKNFIALVESLTQGFSNYKRTGYVQELTNPGTYHYNELLKMYGKAEIIDPFQKKTGQGMKGDTGKGEYRESRVNVISEEDFRHFMKTRKWLPRKQSVEVTIDGIFKGYVFDFNTSELSVLLEKGQKWSPVFDRGEKIKLTANVFNNEYKYDLIIAYVTDRADYVKVGGYFININSEDVDKIYKLKNRFEVMLKSSSS